MDDSDAADRAPAPPTRVLEDFRDGVRSLQWSWPIDLPSQRNAFVIVRAYTTGVLSLALTGNPRRFVWSVRPNTETLTFVLVDYPDGRLTARLGEDL